MFWGLIMEPNRCYTQTIEKSFRITMAALDIQNSSNEPIQVMCMSEERNYLLCTLQKKDKWQCALDLEFDAQSHVSFASNGTGHVHLTGYLLPEDNFDGLMEEAEEEEEEVLSEPPRKKAKNQENGLAALMEELAEEESDSDFDMDDSNVQTQSSDDEIEEEEDKFYEGESGDDEEDEEDEEDDESEEEEEVKVPVKLNGQTKKAKVAKAPEPVKAVKPVKGPKKTVIKGGITVEDLKEGSGEPAKNGKNVSVYYEGRLKQNNKMFDSSTKGPGFSFKLGSNGVIKGWNFGIVGMKVGGKRRITLPPQMAYGAQGSPPTIPPNSTLVFDIELKKIK